MPLAERKVNAVLPDSSMTPKPDQLAEINHLLARGKLKVRVATVLPLAEVKKAHQLSASGHADGKIILRP